MRFALLITALFFVTSLASGAGAVDIEKSVKEDCSKKWKTNYKMVKYCIEQENKAMQELADLLKKYPEGTEEHNIIVRCFNKWNGTSAALGKTYGMTVYCSENQLDAYNSLN